MASRRELPGVTDRREEDRPFLDESGNPVDELLESFERTRWRPAKSPWGAAERRRLETEKRREELMKAWRRRRGRAVTDEREDG